MKRQLELGEMLQAMMFVVAAEVAIIGCICQGRSKKVAMKDLLHDEARRSQALWMG